MVERQSEPYSLEERKAVANTLKLADGFVNQELMSIIVEGLLGIYGRVNFAELESICREYHLQTSFLAVPWTRDMQRANKGTVIINPNRRLEECTFEALTCETPENILYYAQMYEVTDYDPEVNFIRLENAGFAIPRLGIEIKQLEEPHQN